MTELDTQMGGNSQGTWEVCSPSIKGFLVETTLLDSVPFFPGSREKKHAFPQENLRRLCDSAS